MKNKTILEKKNKLSCDYCNSTNIKVIRREEYDGVYIIEKCLQCNKEYYKLKLRKHKKDVL